MFAKLTSLNVSMFSFHRVKIILGDPGAVSRVDKMFVVKVYCKIATILGDPGAVSRVDKMFVVKVYCKIATSPWALTLTEPVPEAFELPASDWPEKNFSGQSAKRSCRVTLVFSYTT